MRQRRTARIVARQKLLRPLRRRQRRRLGHAVTHRHRHPRRPRPRQQVRPRRPASHQHRAKPAQPRLRLHVAQQPRQLRRHQRNKRPLRPDPRSPHFPRLHLLPLQRPIRPARPHAARPSHQPAHMPRRQHAHRVHPPDAEMRAKPLHRRAQRELVVPRQLHRAGRAARRHAQPPAFPVPVIRPPFRQRRPLRALAFAPARINQKTRAFALHQRLARELPQPCDQFNAFHKASGLIRSTSSRRTKGPLHGAFAASSPNKGHTP